MDKNGRVRLFYQIMKEVFDKKTVTLLIANLESIGFFDAPASTKYHGNYPGGLFDHSFAVTKTLLSLTERLELKWKRPQSPYLIGMLHDLCKCDNYIRKPDDTYEYNTGLTLTGHGDCLWMIAEACEALDFGMDDVMQLNIDKLKARYPEGFDTQHSLHRAEGDV